MLMDDDDIIQNNGKYDRILLDGTLLFLSSKSYNITFNRIIGYGSILIGT